MFALQLFDEFVDVGHEFMSEKEPLLSYPQKSISALEQISESAKDELAAELELKSSFSLLGGAHPDGHYIILGITASLVVPLTLRSIRSIYEIHEKTGLGPVNRPLQILEGDPV